MPETTPLQLAREAVAVTREELAVGAGLSFHTIEAIERGRRRPSPATAAAIEKALLRMALSRIDSVEAAVGAVAALDQAADEAVEVAP